MKRTCRDRRVEIAVRYVDTRRILAQPRRDRGMQGQATAFGSGQRMHTYILPRLLVEREVAAVGDELAGLLVAELGVDADGERHVAKQSEELALQLRLVEDG